MMCAPLLLYPRLTAIEAYGFTQTFFLKGLDSVLEAKAAAEIWLSCWQPKKEEVTRLQSMFSFGDLTLNPGSSRKIPLPFSFWAFFIQAV